MAIAFVSVGSGSGSASSATLALSAINLATGNTVVASTKFETLGAHLTAPTDTAGNTYTLLTEQTYNSGNNTVGGAYSVNCAAHATNVVTLNYSPSGNWRQGAACQYSGVATSSAFDQQGGGSGSSTTAATGSITTTSADEVVVGWVGANTSTTYSARVVNAVTATARYTGSDLDMFDLVVTGTFTGTVGCTTSPTGAWGAKTATFIAAAGGASIVPLLMAQYRQRRN